MEQTEQQERQLYEFIDLETGETILIALTLEEFSLYLTSLVGATIFEWEEDEGDEAATCPPRA